MKDSFKGNIHKIRLEDSLLLHDVLDFVRKTFMQSTAQDYEERGIETFLDFIRVENSSKQMRSGRFSMWYFRMAGEIRGMIGVRERKHVSLLFVDEDFRGRGIARSLFTRAMLEEVPGEEITVHSSPYAVLVYQALGFEVLEEEKVEDGIRYIPMCYKGKR